MANMQSRPAPAVADLNVQTPQIGMLAAVERPKGEADTTVFTVASALAEQAGKVADIQAKEEGKRAGAIAGADPNYRPTDGWTLRQRAFDSAGTDVYLSKLTAQFGSDAMDLYQKHHSDPTAFKAGYEGLIANYQKNHVFPEAKGYFDAKAMTTGTSLRQKVLDNFETDQKDQARAQLVEGAATSERNRQQLIAVNPLAPETEAEVYRSADENKQRYRAQVKTGALSAEKVAKLENDEDNNAVGALVLGRAGVMKTPEEIAAYRQKIKADFTEGKLPRLKDWEALDGQLDKLMRQRTTQATHDLSLFTKKVDAVLEQQKDGLSAPSSAWAQLEMDAKVLGPNAQAAVELARHKATYRTKIDNLPLDKAEEMVRGMERNFRDAGFSANGADLMRDLRSRVEAKRNLLSQDQLGAAERDRLIPGGQIVPVDWSAKPDELSMSLWGRMSQADAVAQQYGRTPSYIRPDEKERIKSVLSAGGDPAIQLIQGIVKGAGSRAPVVLKELGTDGDVSALAMAHAGAVGLQTGDNAFTKQVAEAYKARAVPGSKPPTPKAEDINKAMIDVLGSSIAGLDAAERERTKAAVQAWAEVELARRNKDAGDADVGEILKKGVQLARGQSGGYGGIADYQTGHYWSPTKLRVQVPPNVKADKFGDVLAAITDDDLAKLPNPPVRADGKILTASELRLREPTHGPGGYRWGIVDSSKMFTPLRAKDGSVFVLPFDQLAPELRRRVPGAFR